MDVRGEAGAGSHQAALPGQLYLDDVLELVAGDELTPAPVAVMVSKGSGRPP